MDIETRIKIDIGRRGYFTRGSTTHRGVFLLTGKVPVPEYERVIDLSRKKIIKATARYATADIGRNLNIRLDGYGELSRADILERRTIRDPFLIKFFEFLDVQLTGDIGQEILAKLKLVSAYKARERMVNGSFLGDRETFNGSDRIFASETRREYHLYDWEQPQEVN